MRRIQSIIIISLIISGIGFSAHSQTAGNPAVGEDIFRKCKACHQVGEGAKNKAGPVLTDVLGRTAGTFEGYKYGGSMVAAGDAGLIWTSENIFEYLVSPKIFLRTFLRDPKAKAKMSFSLKDEQDRSDVIAYLGAFQTASAVPGNGFCVTNQSNDTYYFAVDAGEAGRSLQQLAPGKTLCTPEYEQPRNGFVSVFEAIDYPEGCSRLVSVGTVEGMVKYADFDRCEWSSHSG